ncbi:MAG: hypothetical protein PHP98_09550 [Kiritimatiellae bacterium]|nr:hypothetical protein [Kiritimatiellia bacterium]
MGRRHGQPPQLALQHRRQPAPAMVFSCFRGKRRHDDITTGHYARAIRADIFMSVKTGRMNQVVKGSNCI